MTEPLYDVIAVRIDSGAKRLIAEQKTERDADAIVSMAAMRCGVEEEFFDAVPTGTWKDRA